MRRMVFENADSIGASVICLGVWAVLLGCLLTKLT